MEKEDIYNMFFISLIIIIGGCFFYQYMEDSEFISKLSYKELDSNEAMQYCIENLNYIFFDNLKAKHCYDMLRTRNID